MQDSGSSGTDTQRREVVLKAMQPLLLRLPEDIHEATISACQRHRYKKGDLVVKQGDIGDTFYVIYNGVAAVLITDKDTGVQEQVASLARGDFFGEGALLRDEPRNATIKAATDMEAYAISRKDFQKLKLNEKFDFRRRAAVGAEDDDEEDDGEEHQPSLKTPAEAKLIAEALQNNANLTSMVTLDEQRIQQLVSVAWKETCSKNQSLIMQHDSNADFFYIVQEGKFEIRVDISSQSFSVSHSPSGNVVGSIGPGGSFGELALLYLNPRAATVTACEDSVVWVIDRRHFKSILLKKGEQQIKEYEQMLKGVEVLNSLLEDEKCEVAKALVEMSYHKDENIIQQGKPGSTFYILYEGSVDIIKDGKVVNTLTADKKGNKTHIFGEKALLETQVREATVKVSSESAGVLALDKESFDILLGPLKDIIKSAAAAKSKPRKTCVRKLSRTPELMSPRRSEGRDQIRFADLKKIGLLGCGGFGAVELHEHAVTGEPYALKMVSKGYIVKSKMKNATNSEKKLQLMIHSKFIIRLYETYNRDGFLMFLLEPALGGELYATYNRKGFHGSAKLCKFYAAGVVFAFEHLHEKKIIFRDLKPENLLLTDTGHVKLTDLGLAKLVVGKTYTTCGTPDYFAPEVIESAGHNRAVDWWTLGILIFELMTGNPPFEAPAPMKIFAKVKKGIKKVNFPSSCHGESEDLVRNLLTHSPAERLPMRSGGTDNIKQHVWYKGFDWVAMGDLTMEPPYIPNVKSKTDIANFTATENDRPPQMPYKEEGDNWDADFATCDE